MSHPKQNIPDQETAEHIKDYLEDSYKLFYHGLKAAAKYDFSVGDVIIKNEVDEDYNGNTVLYPVCVSHTNPSPKKFKVVAVDEFGIGWIRQINSSTGELGTGLETLASFSPEYIHFTPDREQAESILMGDEEGYNPLEAAKKRRKEVIGFRNRNKKKLLQSALSSFWAEKFKELKRGQELWFRTDKRYMGSNGTYFFNPQELENCKIRVISVKTINTIKELKEHDELNHYDTLTEATKMIKNGEDVVVVKYVSKDYTGNWRSAKDASYVHNVAKSGGWSSYDIDKYAMYLEEPEVDETE